MTEPDTSASFSSLGLIDPLVETLAALGYETPTPIQGTTIPLLLSGRDVIGQAQTGTGKTAAFALPILQKIDLSKKHPQALILTPTRELAMQVAEAFHSYAQKLGPVSVLPVYGGAPIVHQLKRLERGVQIVVGTPGRLIDVLDRGTLKLGSIRMFVLDEADEMLKMGFIDDVEKLLGRAPEDRQIALFSATMPAEVLRIAERHLHDPERISVERKNVAAPAIEQRFLNVSESQKLEVLTQILELDESEAVLIFRRTKNGAAELAERLDGRGFPAAAMHGDMKQSERESVIRRLRAGQIEIVVATDVAARGLDVEQISHVVNYDIPHDAEAYVHRIGRTGRAGRTGVATMFITPRERRMMRDIEKFTGSVIKPMKMPTRADVAARRVQQLKETVRKTIEEGDLDLYLELVEQLVEEGQHDIAEIAAAAARLASVARPLAPEREDVAAPAPETAPVARRPSPVGRRLPADPGAAVGRRPPADPGAGVRLRMDVGKNDGIRPADVVGSIANEADVPGSDIGPIDIQDEVTYVTVPQHYVDRIVEKVAKKRFRGKAVNLRVAGPGEGERGSGFRERPRPPYKRPSSRVDSDGPPKFRSRPREDAPRSSSYSRPPARTGSDGPPKFRSRPREDAPRGSYSRPPARAGSEGPPKFRSRPREDAPKGGAFNRFVKRDDRDARPRDDAPRSRSTGGYARRDDRPPSRAGRPAGRPGAARPTRPGPKGPKRRPPR
jgi:ATP-dependent RNA helicase DeaD